MRRFIKLSAMILNAAHINRIDIQKDKYIIYSLSNSSNGWFALGSGFVYPDEIQYNIYANKNPLDYKTVNNWIDQLDRPDVTKI